MESGYKISDKFKDGAFRKDVYLYLRSIYKDVVERGLDYEVSFICSHLVNTDWIKCHLIVPPNGAYSTPVERIPLHILLPELERPKEMIQPPKKEKLDEVVGVNKRKKDSNKNLINWYPYSLVGNKLRLQNIENALQKLEILV